MKCAGRAWAIAAMGILSLVPAVASAQTVEALGAVAEVETRAALRCPPSNAAGTFDRPVRQYPSPEMALWQVYSDGDDLVRIAGADSEGSFDLGAGDDIAVLFDVEGGTSVTGGEGADTILVCSMSDLALLIETGDEDEVKPDVVVIDSAVFLDVPPGMLREIAIALDSFDDRVVVHYPAVAGVELAVRQNHASARIGDVVFAMTAPDPARALTLIADFSAGAGFDADALLTAWRSRACRMSEEEIAAAVAPLGGSADDTIAYVAGLEAAGAIIRDGETDLVLTGVDGCPVAHAPLYEGARWAADLDAEGIAIAQVATLDGTFRLACDGEEALTLELTLPGVADGAATAAISVDGGDPTAVEVACAGAICRSVAPLVDPKLIPALRAGAALAVGGVAGEPVAFPLGGSSRAIASLACAGG